MDFDDLYQEIILDHYRHPRNFGEGEPNCISIEHENPVCGDQIKLMLHVNKQGIVDDIVFNGRGCAISMASASMMTEQVKGKPVEEVKQIIADILNAMRGEDNADLLDQYGDLTALKGVMKFPVRVKCATLSWHALEDLLEQINSRPKQEKNSD